MDLRFCSALQHDKTKLARWPQHTVSQAHHQHFPTHEPPSPLPKQRLASSSTLNPATQQRELIPRSPAPALQPPASAWHLLQEGDLREGLCDAWRCAQSQGIATPACLQAHAKEHAHENTHTQRGTSWQNLGVATPSCMHARTKEHAHEKRQA
eukprot:scaffold31859_cov21-Tisochrysis_lutea.AAC.5